MKLFMIYQLPNDDTELLHNIRFMPYNWILKKGIKLNYKMYKPVYTGYIADSETDNIRGLVENIYTKFNVDIPNDFHGHSLSVSDVVDIDGQAFYIDMIGSVELEGFYDD